MSELINHLGQHTVDGIAKGSIYALIALGYTLVYGVLRLINFAHSEVFMVGTFSVLGVWTILGVENYPSLGEAALVLLVGLVVAAIASGGTALAIERIAYRPLRRKNAPPLIFLITAIGLSLVLVEIFGHLLPHLFVAKPTPSIFGVPTRLILTVIISAVVLVAMGRAMQRANVKRPIILATVIGLAAVIVALYVTLLPYLIDHVLPRLFGRPRQIVGMPTIFKQEAFITVGNTTITNVQFIVVIAALAMMVGLDQFINRTRYGRGVRAVAQNPETAALMGVNQDRVIMLIFVLGGIMAGAAALLWSMRFGITYNEIGFVLGLKAFTAAVLGGIGNLRGALLGGLLLGVVETYTATLTASAWEDVVAFVILVIVLMFRPTGLLGESLGRARA